MDEGARNDTATITEERWNTDGEKRPLVPCLASSLGSVDVRRRARLSTRRDESHVHAGWNDERQRCLRVDGKVFLSSACGRPWKDTNGRLWGDGLGARSNAVCRHVDLRVYRARVEGQPEDVRRNLLGAASAQPLFNASSQVTASRAFLFALEQPVLLSR